ncbi:hypothetical protein I308_100264 [Cryptococcus tetragattii IND107]|uniref:Uncharacterized protein n=1 Tax=Cryptococcus tetragattii IND107 TaxID=1296105 RepID=A0ABR3C4A5_9TREE
MDRKKRTTQKPASSSRRDKTLPLPSPNSGSRTSASPEQPIVPPLGDSTSIFDERWDVYFHAFLLHETKHSDCYYYKGQWWFPENRRNEQTLHMFVAARWAPLEQHEPKVATLITWQYYNLHLPNGKIMENLMFRYVGQSNPQEEWLHDYVGYNLNLVTIDMQVMSP